MHPRNSAGSSVSSEFIVMSAFKAASSLKLSERRALIRFKLSINLGQWHVAPQWERDMTQIGNCTIGIAMPFHHDYRVY